jgi:hypothetical protein
MSSAVAEIRQPTYKQIEKALDNLRSKKITVEQKIAACQEEEAEARRIELARDPSKDPYRRGGLAASKRDEREKAETRLEEIDLTLETLTAELNRAAATRSLDTIKTALARAEELQAARDECWREAASLIAQALEPWNRYAGLLAELDGLTSELKDSEALRLARTLDPALVGQYEQAAVPAEGARVPVDFGAMIEVVLELMLDPRREGHRTERQVLVTRNADASMRPHGEPEQTRTVVETSSRKYGPRLSELVPDKRGEDRRVDVSAAIGTRVATFGAGTPEQTGWQGA